MKTTIFNTIILALLAIFVAACGDASNVNVNPDGSVGECLDEAPASTCGLNGNGLAVFECVDGVWEETGCDDSDICMNGAVDSDVCGNEGLGMAIRTCVDGAWGDFGNCEFATHDDFYTDVGAVFYNEGDSFNESSVGLGEEFTVSMWVKFNGSGIVVGVNGSSTSFSIVCNSAAECTISYTNDNDNYIGFNLSSDGEFQHLVFVMSNTAGMIAYLDGVEVGSTETPYYGSYAESVIRANDNGYGHAADVKHLSFFDGVLSADEVRDLYSYEH